MRITADLARCEGHGLCESQAPEVFSLDDDGVVRHGFADSDLPPELEAAAARGAAACPVAALTIVR